jgi:hypothetical protein
VVDDSPGKVDVNDGIWLSVSDVASLRGVTKQAISKRLLALAGKITTRRDGNRLLINVAEFDRVTGAETDPAQALRNRELPLAKPDGNKAAADFSEQRARREGYDAEMARLKLEELQGKLIPVADVEDAMVRCATVLLRVIEQLPGESDDPALRVILKNKVLEFRATLEREMRLLAERAEAEG